MRETRRMAGFGGAHDNNVYASVELPFSIA